MSASTDGVDRYRPCLNEEANVTELVQMRASASGLNVIFIDPEQYISPDGQVVHYPVEAPQDDDRFVRATAHEAVTRWQRVL